MISPRIHPFLAQRITRMGFGDLTWFNDDAHHGGDVDRRASCKLSDTVTITAAAYEAHNPGHDPGAVEFTVQQIQRGDAPHNANTIASETLVAHQHPARGQQHDNETAHAILKEIDGAIGRRQLHLDDLREARALLADALPGNNSTSGHRLNNDCNDPAEPVLSLCYLVTQAFKVAKCWEITEAVDEDTGDVVFLLRVPSDQAQRIGRILKPSLVTLPDSAARTERATHARHMAAKTKTQAQTVQPTSSAPAQTHADAIEAGSIASAQALADRTAAKARGAENARKHAAGEETDIEATEQMRQEANRPFR